MLAEAYTGGKSTHSTARARTVSPSVSIVAEKTFLVVARRVEDAEIPKIGPTRRRSCEERVGDSAFPTLAAVRSGLYSFCNAAPTYECAGRVARTNFTLGLHDGHPPTSHRYKNQRM